MVLGTYPFRFVILSMVKFRPDSYGHIVFDVAALCQGKVS